MNRVSVINKKVAVKGTEMRGKCNKEKDISHLSEYFTVLGASLCWVPNIFLHFGVFSYWKSCFRSQEIEKLPYTWVPSQKNQVSGRSGWEGIWFISFRRHVPGFTGYEKPCDQREVLGYDEPQNQALWHPSRDFGRLLIPVSTFFLIKLAYSYSVMCN